MHGCFNEAAGIHRRKPVTTEEEEHTHGCFNEAAGIHRRKRPVSRPRTSCTRCFNEAAGIHRRKPWKTWERWPSRPASMRPPEFTGGNRRRGRGACDDQRRASMRPPEFTGGNHGSIMEPWV